MLGMPIIPACCWAYFGDRLHTTNTWIKVCIQLEPCWLASQCAVLKYTLKLPLLNRIQCLLKVYANELCLLTFQWLCWLYLLLCCIGPILALGSIPSILGMPIILACCWAYFGNRLHTINTWIKVCIQLEPCWLASQCAVLGYT